MKLKQSLLVLTITALLMGCDKKSIETKTNPFAGLWSLNIMEQQDSITSEWSEWRNGMQGYILYDEKDNMSVHLTTKGYEKTDLRFPNFIDSIPNNALKHLTGSYVYFAKYTIDENQNVVEHAKFGQGEVLSVEGAGTSKKAEIRFESGDTKKLLLQFAKLKIIG